jgi:Reverse transcriptase (RNA-dependent DNA polymerase)
LHARVFVRKAPLSSPPQPSVMNILDDSVTAERRVAPNPTKTTENNDGIDEEIDDPDAFPDIPDVAASARTSALIKAWEAFLASHSPAQTMVLETFQIVCSSEDATAFSPDDNFPDLRPYLSSTQLQFVTSEQWSEQQAGSSRIECSDSIDTTEIWPTDVKETSVFASEIVHPSDPRSATFGAAIRKEIEGLLANETIMRVPRASVPPGATTFRSRFVKSFIHTETHNPVQKARIVVQSAFDPQKRFLITHAPTVHRLSPRLLCAIAASKGFKVWTLDVTQAFLQSDEPLMRDVYVVPPKEMNLPAEEIWRIQKPIYGIAESPKLWRDTCDKHHTEKSGLSMVASLTDPCLYVRRSANGEVFGATALQVDDTLSTGCENFQVLEKERSTRFRGSPADVLTAKSPIKFIGSVLEEIV